MIHTTPAERQTRGVRLTHTRGNDSASARSRETALLLLFWLINSYTEHLEMFYHVEVAW